MENNHGKEYIGDQAYIKKLVRTTSEKINPIIIGISFSGGMILSFLIPFILGKNMNDDYVAADAIWGFFVFFLIISALVIKLESRSENLSYFSRRLIEKNEEMINKSYSMEDIVNTLKDIQGLINELQKYKNSLLVRITNLVTFGRIYCWIYEYMESIKPVISMIHKDIYIFAEEQQSTLEQAKSEVSTHIHGTDELNRVSELQRQRLDKQIEQFEELQRVLVKV